MNYFKKDLVNNILLRENFINARKIFENPFWYGKNLALRHFFNLKLWQIFDSDKISPDHNRNIKRSRDLDIMLLYSNWFKWLISNFR